MFWCELMKKWCSIWSCERENKKQCEFYEENIEIAPDDYYKKMKKQKEWCDQCHARDDCDSEEEFLESEETTCSWYA